MSVLPPRTDVQPSLSAVRFVPLPDSCAATNPVRSRHRGSASSEGLAQTATFTSSSDSRKAGPCRSSRQRTSASWQPQRELGEVADLAVDRNSAAVLLRYN